MAKVSVRQVVGAVRRMRGQRGARLCDVVDCVVEEVHLRAVAQALRALVRTGVLQRRGRHFRLATEQRHTMRRRRIGAERQTRRGRRRRRAVSSVSRLHHIREPRSCFTLVGSSSSRTCSKTSSRCNVCRKQKSSSVRSSNSNLTVNHRLASTRDSVEILKERLSNRSTQVGESSVASECVEEETNGTSCFHWLNQNHQAVSSQDTMAFMRDAQTMVSLNTFDVGTAQTISSFNTLAVAGAAQTMSSLDALPLAESQQTEELLEPPNKKQKFPYFPWS